MQRELKNIKALDPEVWASERGRLPALLLSDDKDVMNSQRLENCLQIIRDFFQEVLTMADEDMLSIT